MKSSVVKLAMAALALCAVAFIPVLCEKTPSNEENGTDSAPAGFVDIGLDVYWAECNVGATKPEEFGDLFA